MRFVALLFVAIMLAGCASQRYDARLQGTWHSNRAATVARAFQRDPRWTNAPPAKVQRFKDLFGQMTVIYSNDVVTTDYKGEIGTSHYRVVKRGADSVVIHPVEGFGNYRIQFADGGRAYWVDSGFGIEERFDKVATPPNTSLEPTSTAP